MTTFYIAPDGNDQHPGTEDQPFATLNSISADPLFEDLENADFRLQPNSPALNLGFQPIDMNCIGLTQDFPKHFRRLDEPEDNSNPEYDRGRNPNKEAYAWW